MRLRPMLTHWCSTRWPWVILFTGTLDRALQMLEADGGLSRAGEERIVAAVAAASAEIARFWETERAVPPLVIWRRTLDEVRDLGNKALACHDEQLPGARAYGEVPFGARNPNRKPSFHGMPRQPSKFPAQAFVSPAI